MASQDVYPLNGGCGCRMVRYRLESRFCVVRPQTPDFDAGANIWCE